MSLPGKRARPKKNPFPFWALLPVGAVMLYLFELLPARAKLFAAVGYFVVLGLAMVIMIPGVRTRLNRAINGAANDFGLRRTRSLSLFSLSGNRLRTYLEGVVEGFQVSLHYGPGWTVTIDGRGRTEGALPERFFLLPRPSGDDPPPEKRYLTLGDRNIDDPYLVGGPRDTALAALSIAVRKEIGDARAADLRIRIEGGRLYLTSLNFDKITRLSESIRLGLRLAGSIAEAARDIPATLGANARMDSMLAVRRLNLEVLARDFPGHPETAASLEAALKSPFPEMRLEGAKHAGEEGFETLSELVYEESTAAELRADALSHLASNYPAGRITPLVVSSLRSRTAPLLVAALRAARWLGLAGVEQEVIDALGHLAKSVRRAAVVTLAKVGTALAVEPLQRLESDARLDFETARAVRGAVEQIQGRLHGAGEGQVSLAGGEAPEGQVSLSAEEGEEGRVTLGEEKGTSRRVEEEAG